MGIIANCDKCGGLIEETYLHVCPRAEPAQNVSQTETITVIEEWTRTSMIRYVHARNGERIVLERIENPAHPYVMFSGPETFNNQYWTYKASMDNQDYSSQCEQVPDWVYET